MVVAKKKPEKEVDMAIMTIRQVVSFNFRRFMAEKGWNETETSEKGGVELNYISQILNNHIGFGIHNLIKWSDIFDINPLDFYKTPEDITLEPITRNLKENPSIIKSVEAFIQILLDQKK